MKKYVQLVFIMVILVLSSLNVFAQPIQVFCPDGNCTNAGPWHYSSDYTEGFKISETTYGTPPLTFTIPCTTRVYYDFKWRFCDGIREFELIKFWWDYNQCPIDYNDPNFLDKMKDIHNRLFPQLIYLFLEETTLNGVTCPPYCCPNGFVSATAYSTTCFFLSIQWDEGSVGSGITHHTLLTSSTIPISTYIEQVPAGVTPYIVIENCEGTACCKRKYKLCIKQNAEGDPLVTEDEVQDPQPNPEPCFISPTFSCYPRCR